METVVSKEQLLQNISTLETARNSTTDRASYLSLIRNGRCFLPYIDAGVVRFAPSRFIGYVDNTIEDHNHNEQKDGKKTNPAVSKTVGAKPIEDGAMEARYQLFCKQLQLAPSPNVKRKYWVTLEIAEALEQAELKKIELDPAIGATERAQLVKARIGQGIFRDKLLKYWKRCALTGCSVVQALKASHIKCWCDSSNSQRLDLFNGLLLTANADALFDSGLISFETNGTMIVSKKISKKEVRELVGTFKSVAVAKEHAPYLQWHRENRLQK